MSQAVGQVGSVVQCVSDGELMVKVGDQLWPLNSKCCILQPNGRPDANNTLAASNNCVLNHTGELNHTHTGEPNHTGVLNHTGVIDR